MMEDTLMDNMLCIVYDEKVGILKNCEYNLTRVIVHPLTHHPNFESLVTILDVNGLAEVEENDSNDVLHGMTMLTKLLSVIIV